MMSRLKDFATFVRTPHNYDGDVVSFQTGLKCDDPPLTTQSELDECDINQIVRRFGVTGELPYGDNVPSYDDFTGITDYQTALNAIIEAEAGFMSLNAHIRARFDNDPQKFIEFMADNSNQDEAIKLGLAFDTRPKAEADSSADNSGAAAR